MPDPSRSGAQDTWPITSSSAPAASAKSNSWPRSSSSSAADAIRPCKSADLSVLALLAERKLIPPKPNRNCAKPTSSCAGWNIACSTSRTNRRTCCRKPRTSGKIAAAWASPTGRPCWRARTSIREIVSRHFEAVFSDPEAGEHPLTGLWLGQIDEDNAIEGFGNLGFRRPRKSIAAWPTSGPPSRYQQLPATNRSRLDAVGPRLIEAAGATGDPDTTLARGLTFLEGIARRGAYLALLQQYPMACAGSPT